MGQAIPFIEQRHLALLALLTAVITAILAACASPPPAAPPASAPETWSVTAWGKTYEIFPDVEALVVGQVSMAHTHVTVLDGFTALDQGTVEIVLRGPGSEAVFSVTEPDRPGIFAIELRPTEPGDFDLAFRVGSAHGDEEIRGGRVRVGTTAKPGTAIVVPAPKGATAEGEPLPFLKEEQWRTEFATAWVRSGSLPRSIAGLGRLRPAAGGSVSLTAPVDAVLRPDPWPYPGLRLNKGAAAFRLVPRVAEGSSLSALAAEAASQATELATARARLTRLEELLTLEATSRREVEEARSLISVLEQQQAAAAADLEAARSAREGGATGAMTLPAPFSGQIAEVTASPGAAVSAGDPLARLVRTDPLWLEVAVTSAQARGLAADGLAGVVAVFSDGAILRPTAEQMRLISVAPEMDAETGMVTALVEIPGGPGFVLGSVVETQLLLAESVPGVVLPATALVDDSGVAVVYLQLSGERFARQPVEINHRQGNRVLVQGLLAGQRVVSHGGEAIRRSSLMSSGQAHGHVH